MMRIVLGAAGEILDRTLAAIEADGVGHVLMDRYEELPEAYSGQDIDLLVSSADAPRAARTLKAMGWALTDPNGRAPWRAFRYEEDPGVWVVLDLALTRRWHAPALAEGWIYHPARNDAGLRVLPAHALLAWKLFKDLRTGRLSEPDRWARVHGLRRDAPPDMVDRATAALGALGLPLARMPVTARFMESGETAGGAPGRMLEEAIEMGLGRRPVPRDGRRPVPPLPTLAWAAADALRPRPAWRRFSFPIVAVVGIDGSGKTTLCRNLVGGLFNKTNVRHQVMRRVDPAMPAYRALRGPLKRLAGGARRVPLLGAPVAASVNGLIEAGDFLDRLARYARARAWARGGHGTVLLERYATDRLMGTVVRPRFHLEQYFPLPDLLLHLDVAADDSVQRKIEDDHDLREQSEKRANYLKLLERYPCSTTIPAGLTEEEVLARASALIWTAIRKEQGL